MKPTIRLQALLALLAPLAVAGIPSGCATGAAGTPLENQCGDGVKGGDEQCDDGDENGNTPDACRADCTRPRCGDGVVDTGETCDDGNEDSGDGCDSRCQESYVCGDAECSKDLGEACSVCADDCCPCGDGACSLGETCNGCPQDCCPDCGNGALDPGEGCDDDNNEDGDGCSRSCVDEDGQATCGNGFLEAGEVCDDGNTVGADGCGADCKLEYVCGDGICEHTVGENCVTCQNDCCPNCGDGILNDFEECDGSVPAGSPTCQDQCYPGGSPICTSCLIDYTACQGELPVCGNGVRECGEECDGGAPDGLSCDALGYDGGSLGCSSSCTVDLGECGEFVHYLREEFASCPPQGWVLGFPWTCGAPTGGPGSAFSPPNVVSPSINGSYGGGLSPYAAHVTTPPVNLSQATTPSVAFRAWHALGSGDGISVLASTDGTNFSPISQVTPAYTNGTYWGGNSAGWVGYSASLLQYVGQPQVWVRIGMQSDSSSNAGAGVFIDDVVIAESCGNGVVEPGEVCDGAAMGPSAVCSGGTCGTPTCAADCQSFDVASCITPDCGNGTRECDEQCDGNDYDGATCTTLGYDGGNLSCNASCQIGFASCGPSLFLLQEQGFETCPPAGWTVAGAWQCGAPTSGPNAAHGGTNVVATNLAGDYGANLSVTTSYVETPPFTVTGADPTFAFWMWLNSETIGSSYYDGVRLQVSTNGTTWSNLTSVTPAYHGTTSGGEAIWAGVHQSYTRYRASLSAYAGQTIRVRIGFRSDSSFQYPGAYVDDVVAVPTASLLP